MRKGSGICRLGRCVTLATRQHSRGCRLALRNWFRGDAGKAARRRWWVLRLPPAVRLKIPSLSALPAHPCPSVCFFLSVCVMCVYPHVFVSLLSVFIIFLSSLFHFISLLFFLTLHFLYSLMYHSLPASCSFPLSYIILYVPVFFLPMSSPFVTFFYFTFFSSPSLPLFFTRPVNWVSPPSHRHADRKV